jgi:hypothetical protein
MQVEAIALAVTIRLGQVIHLLPVHVGHFGSLRRRSIRIFGRIAIGPKPKRQNILHADQFQAAIRLRLINEQGRLGKVERSGADDGGVLACNGVHLAKLLKLQE